MNYKQISEKYPKAWGTFWRFYFPNYDLEAMLKWLSEDATRIYIFYHFFDSEGIYVDIEVPDKYHPYFTWMVLYDKDKNTERNFNSLTRPEAEEQAFEKAFGILEARL